MPPEKNLTPYPRPKSLFGVRAVTAPEHGDTCAYCGASIEPSAERAQPGVCACGAQNSGVSARERLQQQMAG